MSLCWLIYKFIFVAVGASINRGGERGDGVVLAIEFVKETKRYNEEDLVRECGSREVSADE